MTGTWNVKELTSVNSCIESVLAGKKVNIYDIASVEDRSKETGSCKGFYLKGKQGRTMGNGIIGSKEMRSLGLNIGSIEGGIFRRAPPTCWQVQRPPDSRQII